MASLNQASVIGYVAAEPKIIATQNQRKMAAFALATTERGGRRQDGTQLPDRTEWHSIVCFGKIADVAEMFVRKGSLLFVQGRLATRSYEDKQGQKRYVTEILADTMQMLDRRPAADSQAIDPGQPCGQQEPPF